MIKLFGIEAEINLTVDEHVVKSLGKDFTKMFEEIKPDLIKSLKNILNKEVK